MKVTLKATAEIIENARQRMSEEHAGFYARQIQSVAVNKNTSEAAQFIGKTAESFGYGFRQSQDGKRFCWITSGSNIVMCDAIKNTVTFLGVRHGISPLWQYVDGFRELTVIYHESTMPWVSPWMTLDEFCENACKTSANPHSRALALLKEGKNQAFLHAEGLPVRDAIKMLDTCKRHGYI